MPRPDRNTQVRLSRETADKLRRLAAELGYVQTRGIMAGELGSIAQMFDAVARGELQVVRSLGRSDTPRPAENGGKTPETAGK